ncbi:MAG: tetratricopeptide repeat protein, partial [Comamonadaceae bacterium]
GNAALGEGRIADAADCYRRATEADPADPLARVNLGYALLEQADPAAAVEPLERAIGLGAPGAGHLPDAWFLLARAQRDLGRTAQAVDSFTEALRCRAAFPEALHELVLLLQTLGRHVEALPWAQRLAAVRPSAAAGLLLAQELHYTGQAPAALEVLDELIAADPGNTGAMTGRGHVLLRLGRFDDAIAAFRLALQREGPQPDRLVDLAGALQRAGQFEEGIRLHEQALALAPGHAGAWNLRVHALIAQLRLPEAAAMARQAIALHPDDADLHWNLGIACMLQGRWREGWAEHGWRWRSSDALAGAPVRRPEPAWRGEPLQGRRLVLVAEQGLGDTLQFARYVPLLAASAREVELQAPTSLHRLLRGLAPNLRVTDAAPAAGDVHCA